ncbi:hypothetical protein JZ751_003942 [Albula glossodonta]|uniref:Ig-like domain-containing protein n=1 Tax=Albula glossodonta TaxID=121402 RepID=A0A8T2P5T7_9TELE|nr:hypothetical protein JZ751_003942 [Albula glossodonta]
MKATQKDCWYFMVLMILLSLIEDVFLKKQPDSIVKLEESITLECVCPWSGNLSMISWVQMPGKKHIAAFHPEFGVAISMKDYDGRLKFLRSSLMDGSITISNTTANDTGLYQCSVQTFPKGSWTKDISVEESVSLDWSTPIPEVVEKGNTFMLKCNFEDNGSVYRVTFEKVREKSINTMALCNKMEGSVLAVDYRERVMVNCSDILGVGLRLMNVTEEDRGIYRCHFSTHTGLLNNYEQAALYDRMKKHNKQEESEVYANIPSVPRRTKKT